MKKLQRLSICLSLAALPLSLLASDQPPGPASATSGSLELGFWLSSLTGSPDVVSRYAPADVSRPQGLLSLETHPDWGNIRLSMDARSEDLQRHSLEIDVGRVVRSRTTYTRFLARLGHDPMTNLEATTTHGRVVHNTDHDPDAVYELTDGLLEHRTEIQPSGLSALTVGLGFRDLRRDGHHQSFTVSHCDTCHVVSRAHPIDAKLSWLRGFIKGSLTRRQLRQGTASVDVTYDRALHPELRTPVFDNRIQFDSVDGPQPVDHLQDADKNVARVDLHLSDVGGFSVAGGGVWSKTENKFTTLEADYKGYTFSASRRFKKRLTLRLRGRAYFLSNDDIFVDVVEPVSIAGPHIDRTYREVYGFDPDYLRQSALNRDVIESSADVSYKLGKRAGTVKALWKFKSVDRQHYEVAPGATKTTTNVVGLSWRPRLAKGLRLKGEYRHGSVDNPLMNVDAACSTLFSPRGLASPFLPEAAQYYEFQNARVADSTASPASWDDVRLRASYTKSRTSFSATYRWWDGTNTSGDLTDWSRTNQSATASIWRMPSPRYDFYAAYSWQQQSLGSPTCIPLYDG